MQNFRRCAEWHSYFSRLTSSNIWLGGIIDIADLTTLLIARFEKRRIIEWSGNKEFKSVLSATTAFLFDVLG